MIRSNITLRDLFVPIACLASVALLACDDPPRFARDDCAKSPTAECLLYFAHQAALEIDDSQWDRDFRLSSIALQQFRVGDEVGAMTTIEGMGSDYSVSVLYLELAEARARSGDLDGAASFLESLGDPIPLRRHHLRRYAKLQALAGDYQGALGSLDEALNHDQEWRSELRQRADWFDEEANSEDVRPYFDLSYFYQIKSRRTREAADRAELEAEFDNDPTLREIAIVLARHGKPQAALEFARRIRGPSDRARAYLKVGEEFTHSEAGTDSLFAAQKALDAAKLLEPGLPRVRLLTELAEAMLQLDLTELAEDALKIAKRDAASAISGLEDGFQAVIAIAVVEGRLGRVQDAWKTIQRGLALQTPSYVDHANDPTLSDLLRLVGTERYREASRVLSHYVRDPGMKGEILVDIADAAKRMGEVQAAKSLLGLASREAERLPPKRFDGRRSLLDRILGQYSHLGDEFGTEQTVSRMFSSLVHLKGTENREEVIREYVFAMLLRDEAEAAGRMLREMHHPNHEDTLTVSLSAGDLEALEEVVPRLEDPALRFKALLGIRHGRARAGAAPDVLHAVEREMSLLVAEILDLADPEDRSQHLESMAGYLLRGP